MATLDALGRRADDQRRRRGGTHASAATTTPTVRTTTSAGRRGILPRADRDFLEFSRRVIRIWKDHPVLRRRKFFQGRRIRGAEVLDIAWLDPSGREMTDATWSSPDVRCLGVRLNGDAIGEVDERGERIAGDSLPLLFNAGETPVSFVLPVANAEERWETLIDTADPWRPPQRFAAPGPLSAAAHARWRC